MQSGQDQPETDEDRRQRRRVNIAAGVFLVALIALAVWTVKLFTDQEKLQRCLESRRTNCFDLQQPPSGIIRLPSH